MRGNTLRTLVWAWWLVHRRVGHVACAVPWLSRRLRLSVRSHSLRTLPSSQGCRAVRRGERPVDRGSQRRAARWQRDGSAMAVSGSGLSLPWGNASRTCSTMMPLSYPAVEPSIRPIPNKQSCYVVRRDRAAKDPKQLHTQQPLPVTVQETSPPPRICPRHVQQVRSWCRAAGSSSLQARRAPPGHLGSV